jgi:hypothetical protein
MQDGQLIEDSSHAVGTPATPVAIPAVEELLFEIVKLLCKGLLSRVHLVSRVFCPGCAGRQFAAAQRSASDMAG